VMVLAVIVGIGTGLFGQFTTSYGASQPTIEQALSVVLAALALLGLGIFGPGIATGLVSGAPQLGAGAAVGTGLAVAGAAVGAGAAVAGGGAALAGAGRATGAAPLKQAARNASGSLGERLQTGARSAFAATGGSSTQGTVAASTESAASATGGALSPPAWAQRMRRHQATSHGVTTLAHAVRSGDSGGGGHSVDLSERG